MFCDRCEQMKQTLATVQETIQSHSFESEGEKVEQIYLAGVAIQDIQEWKGHILRAVHQDKVKEDFIRAMDSNTIFITLDWAMKWLPTKGRETQSEWFGKRGISDHISVILLKENAEFRKRSYVHVFNRAKQDTKDVIGITQHTLQQVKKERPHVTKAILRSDNAGCYHSSQLIGTIHAISAATQIDIIHWSFSEPQHGKGPCDRMAATIKRKVRMWVDENNPATTAREFVDGACSYNGIQGVSFYVGNTEEPPSSQIPQKISILGISGYLDFAFNVQREVTMAWRFLGIGSGVTINRRHWQNKDYVWRFVQSYQSHPNNAKDEPLDGRYWKNLKSSHAEVADDHEDEVTATASESQPQNQKLFDCPVEGCIKKFKYYGNLINHMDIGTHTFLPVRETLRDFAVGMFKEKLEEMTAFRHSHRNVILKSYNESSHKALH